MNCKAGAWERERQAVLVIGNRARGSCSCTVVAAIFCAMEILQESLRYGFSATTCRSSSCKRESRASARSCGLPWQPGAERARRQQRIAGLRFGSSFHCDRSTFAEVAHGGASAPARWSLSENLCVKRVTVIAARIDRRSCLSVSCLAT